MPTYNMPKQVLHMALGYHRQGTSLGEALQDIVKQLISLNHALWS